MLRIVYPLSLVVCMPIGRISLSQPYIWLAFLLYLSKRMNSSSDNTLKPFLFNKALVTPRPVIFTPLKCPLYINELPQEGLSSLRTMRDAPTSRAISSVRFAPNIYKSVTFLPDFSIT